MRQVIFYRSKATLLILYMLISAFLYGQQNTIQDKDNTRQGVYIDPVKIYPTIITGNTVNIVAGLPVERINVFAVNGQQVFSKEIGGKMDAITVVLPSLGKGMYWMHCWGRGWKTTRQFIIP